MGRGAFADSDDKNGPEGDPHCVMGYLGVACNVLYVSSLRTSDPAGWDDGPRRLGLRGTILRQNAPETTITTPSRRLVMGASFLVGWGSPARWMKTITNTLCAHEDCELVCRAIPQGCGYHDSEVGSPARLVGREALTGLRKGSGPGLSLPCIWQPGKSPTDDPPRKMMHTAYSATRNLHHLPMATFPCRHISRAQT